MGLLKDTSLREKDRERGGKDLSEAKLTARMRNKGKEKKKKK